tara:strand:- start:34 stop:138 length:105 start_codon:yes stop_codon:yes gene_type:complete
MKLIALFLAWRAAAAATSPEYVKAPRWSVIPGVG